MVNNSVTQLKLAFYGDDFTGSTDVMESLALLGIPTALFMNPPSTEQLNSYTFRNSAFANQKMQAVGVAGISRSYSNEQMEKALPPIFEKMAQWQADYFHYKICSTFDSSPTIGNIGKAIEIAIKYFNADFIPLLVGMPRLNRFVVFGNLFARINEHTYRLDRHPTMSRHPITPMDESDLLKHLGKQTTIKSRLIDVLTIDSDYLSSVNILKEAQNEIVLFDTLSMTHLIKIGEILKGAIQKKNQLVVGSSAIENALFKQKNEGNLTAFTGAGKANKMLVMSGSCSPVTTSQIKYAEQKGFKTLAIDAVKLLNESNRSAERTRVKETVHHIIQNNTPIICYSALGPDDPTVQQVKNISGGQDLLPILLGELLKQLIETIHPDRVIAAGGDTSGKITQLLEIESLEFLMPLAPGAPMCIAHSLNKYTDNLQIILKGGQNGNETFFEKAYLGNY
jgi:uncharacterized protein YgbK (DUF1537 family)